MQKIFLTVIDMSIVSSLVIAGVLLVRALLKRAPRRFSYLLWAAVLVRLLCPFAVESPVSLIPQRAGELAQSAAAPGSENVTFVSAASAALGDAGAAADGGRSVIRIEVAPETPETGGEAAERQYVSASRWQVWLMLCAWLWPLGAAAVLVWGAASQLYLRRMLVGAVRDGGNVWLADRIPTAFVMGLFRPRIYLPSTLGEPGRGYVLEHEHTHIRRGDHIFRLLAFVALALHWFNPLVWLAFTLSGRDMELSCDEAVLRRKGEGVRADYCQTLLDMSARKAFPGPCPLAFGEGDTGARIKNALSWKKPALWVVLGAAALIALACALLLTNPTARRENKVEISFPAYQDGRDSGDVYDPVYDFGPFTVSLTLPKGWTVLPPEESDKVRVAEQWDRPEAAGCTLYTPVELYDEKGEYAGFVGWSDYDEYDSFTSWDVFDAGGVPVPEEEYYKSVYYALRLGAHYAWTDFESVKSDERGETHRARVYWQEQDEELPAAAWTQHNVPGICRYDRGLGVYACVQLIEGAATEREISEMAESIELLAGGQTSAGDGSPVAVELGFSGAYSEDGEEFDCGEFTAELRLPAGWTVRAHDDNLFISPPPYTDKYSLGIVAEGLYEPMDIFNENGGLVGAVGFRVFDPEGANPYVRFGDLSDEEYYRMMVYYDIFKKNGRDYTLVKSTDSSETTTLKTGSSMSVGNELKSWVWDNVLHYDKEIGAYIGVWLLGEAATEEDVRVIAESVGLSRGFPKQSGGGSDSVSSREFEFVVPGYYGDGGQVFECRAFSTRLTLPEGWKAVNGASEPSEHSDYWGMKPMTWMYTAEGEYAGFIAWGELSRPMEANHYDWEEVSQVQSGETEVRTLDIIYDLWDESLLPEHPWRQFETVGIHAENEALGVYLRVQFAPGVGSEEELVEMARSIAIGKAEDRHLAGFGGLGFGAKEESVREVFADLLLEGEPLRRRYAFNGRPCTAYYEFDLVHQLNGGSYVFGDETALDRQEQIDIYTQLRDELTAMYGEAKPTSVYTGDMIPVDLQAVINGVTDQCADVWTARAPSGGDVQVQLSLGSDGRVSVRYALQ